MSVKLINIASGITAPGVGAPIRLVDEYTSENCYQITLVGTGAVTAAAVIEVSNDNIGWISDANSTVNLSGNDNVSVGFISSSAWGYVRARVSGISGTNASLSVTAAIGDNMTLGISSDIYGGKPTRTRGWRDITTQVTVRGVGANDPTFSVYTGTTFRAFSFSATTMNEVFAVFHVPHDWIPGTAIHLHAHWSNAAAAPSTGNVIWGFDYSFAKGFGQEAFPVQNNVIISAPSPAISKTHNISETPPILVPGMEIDGILLVRCYRDAANVLDTCTNAVFLHTMDIHYESDSNSTKNKAPNFYN